MTTIAPFDVADYLDNEEVITEYLNAALEDPDPAMFIVALGNVARARGMTRLANDSGLGRESLTKPWPLEQNHATTLFPALFAPWE